MYRGRVSRVLGLAVAIAIVLAGCGTAQNSTQNSILTKVLSSHQLTVGTINNFPPYESTDSSGKLVGYEIDIANELAKSLGATIKWTIVTIPGRVTSLQTNQVQMVVGGFSMTPTRAQTINFSNAVAVTHGEFAVLAKRTDLKTIDDINKSGIKLAGARGTTMDVWAPAAAPNAQYVPYNTNADALQAVLSGQADALPQANDYIRGLLTSHPGVFTVLPGYYDTEEINIGTPLGDFTWLNWINYWVKNYVESGQDAADYYKWFKYPIGESLPNP
jgi:polar amino acid transport system substrate-binding protein